MSDVDVTKRPKGAPRDALSIRNTKLSTHQTLLMYLSENNMKTRLTYLKSFAERQGSSSKWVEYLNFIRINGSGDIETFSDKDRAYVEKMIKAIDDEHSA